MHLSLALGVSLAQVGSYPTSIKGGKVGISPYLSAGSYHVIYEVVPSATLIILRRVIPIYQANYIHPNYIPTNSYPLTFILV